MLLLISFCGDVWVTGNPMFNFWCSLFSILIFDSLPVNCGTTQCDGKNYFGLNFTAFEI